MNHAFKYGHFRNRFIGGTLPYIRPKAYVREYPHKIWPYLVQYLHFRIPLMHALSKNYPSLVLDFLSINMKHRSFGCSQAWPHTVCLVLATRAKRIPFGSIFYFMAVRRQVHGTSIVCHSVPGYPSVFW